MKRYLCCILAVLILFSLAGCSGSGNIVGIWEQEMDIPYLIWYTHLVKLVARNSRIT